FGQAGGDVAEVFGACEGAGFGEDEFGAKGCEGQAFVGGHGFGHAADEAVAAGGGDHGQAHAGVSGGSFDEGVAGFDEAAGFGVVDDGNCGTIFDGTAGVHVLTFCV